MRKRLIDRLGGEDRISRETTNWGVVIDWQLTGKAWPSAREVWKRHGDGATHHLLLQDDAWPCNDFWTVLRKVIAAAPDAILVLCTPGWGKLSTEDHFIRASHMTGQAVVMPTAIIPHFLDWERKAFRPAYPHSDVRIEFYAKTMGIPLLSTLPSIVDHRDEGKSALGHKAFRALRYDEDADQREEWVLPENPVDERYWGLTYDTTWWMFERGELGDRTPPAIPHAKREAWLAEQKAAAQ